VSIWRVNLLKILHQVIFFTRESSYCFQRILAIPILSVRPFVRPSHRWISQKRCKIGPPNLYHTITRCISVTVRDRA